ncbi:hypothetical protein GCM10011380_08290 [Sphingomonas metalli]|uniref:MlaB-like STAS domain-containing protein n=1 Tax=Sphingomonas metalli TaxID=1779358 RepID=A0A916SX70_9SPHN|nr:STAS domain-containing protein [Sphingomonas metalli]GGB21040.1 hypothetical protein GCM10011380_08290 [Sphingomonas metalli]
MNAIVLPAVIDLAAVHSLAATLRGEPGSILLDGTAVERIGGAGIQLLLSAHATAAAAGHVAMVERPSEALAAAIATAGAGILLAPDR